MRLKVRVCYGDESVEMEVACGNGLNSVKWLATVATQRLTTQNAPHGRIRRSEDKSFLVASHRRLQASDVTTDEQTKFYHPDAQLVDCFDDGQRVNVIVEKDAKLDEATGGRILSRWAIVAYCQSQPERVAAALKEENFEREEALRQRKLEDEERKTDDDRVKAQLMRNLISSQLIESDRLEVKMKEEWEHMNRRGLVESWIRAEKERDKVFQLLKENFVSLLELFRFYGASTTSAVDAHLMEFVEFCAFCRDIDIFGGPNDLINHTTLAGAFAECAGIDVADVKYAHFEFGDFLASLIWLALTTKGGLGGTKSSAPTGFTSKEAVDSARRSIMRIKDLSQIGSAFPTSQALKQLLDENISSALKLHQSQLIGPVTKEKLATDEILAIFYVHVDRLQAVFKTYVSKLPKEEDFQLTEGYMTMNEYIVLLEHSKLIGGGGDSTGENEKDSTAKNTRNKDHEHDVLTMKEVRQAFAGAQDDDLDVTAPPAKSKHSVKTSTATGIISRNTAESNGSGGAAGNQSMLLSFAEFLEVVLRLALLKWDDDTYTTGQKLTMAIEAVLANSVSKMTTTTARGGRRRSSLFRSEDEISAIRDCESLILSVGRAFYNDESVLVLETLVNEKYLKEEDMGRRLHMSERQARRAMQYLEQERLVRSETVSDSKKSDVYWYVDLAMFRDVVKYRLHLTRKGAGENERRATASLTFKCANCGTRRPLADAAKYKFKCPEPDCVEDGWDLKEEAVNVSLVQAQRLVAKIQDQLSSTTDRTGIYELLARIENKKLPSNRPSENRAVGLGGTPIFADCSTTATVTTRSQAAAAHTSSFSGSAPALFSKNLQGQEILVDFDDRDDEIEWEEGVVSSSSSSSSEEEDY